MDRRAPRPESHGNPGKRSKPSHLRPPSSTGAEAAYLRSLIDSRTMVRVILKTGEQMRGRIRYYDRDCFSLRVADGGPKLLLRKSSVLEIQEE
jgi:sRNA-binding regulator protein Hfq